MHSSISFAEKQLLEQNISRLSEFLSQTLLEKKLKLATAESCTGGGIAAALTQISGSSQWFEYGIVSYADEAKIKLLGVSESLLEAEGAVSEAVVKEMLAGVLRLSGANLAIAVSGIAGPAGGSDEKPVGTVWFALGELNNPQTIKKVFGGDRRAIQLQSIEFALSELSMYKPSR